MKKKNLLFSLGLLFVFSNINSAYSQNIKFNEEQALKTIISGRFDQNHKSVIHKMPANIRKQFEFSNDENFMTNILFTKQFQEKGQPKQIVVTQSRDDTSDCHSCAPIIGIAVFKSEKNKWVVSDKLQYIAKIGTWGHAPTPQLIEIGKDNYGLIFEDGYTGMGITTGSTDILGKVNGKYKVLLTQLNTYEDNNGSCGKEVNRDCYTYDSKINFEKNNQPFYPINFTYKGTKLNDKDKAIAFNQVQKFIFSKDSYIPAK